MAVYGNVDEYKDGWAHDASNPKVSYQQSKSKPHENPREQSEYQGRDTSLARQIALNQE